MAPNVHAKSNPRFPTGIAENMPFATIIINAAHTAARNPISQRPRAVL